MTVYSFEERRHGVAQCPSKEVLCSVYANHRGIISRVEISGRDSASGGASEGHRVSEGYTLVYRISVTGLEVIEADNCLREALKGMSADTIKEQEGELKKRLEKSIEARRASGKRLAWRYEQ